MQAPPLKRVTASLADATEFHDSSVKCLPLGVKNAWPRAADSFPNSEVIRIARQRILTTAAER